MSKPLRLFFALWPETEVRSRLQARVAELGREWEGRRVAPSNLHLTLKFLGVCEASRVEAMVAELNQLEAAAFTLRIDCAGWWRRSQIAWLGCRERSTECLSLVNMIEKVASDHGVSPSPKPFRPHITIARKVTQFAPCALVEPLEWAVTDFVLVTSALDHNGASYRVTHRWPLITSGLADTAATPV